MIRSFKDIGPQNFKLDQVKVLHVKLFYLHYLKCPVVENFSFDIVGNSRDWFLKAENARSTVAPRLAGPI